MSYHSSQDPEENLPDWLKELRRRQRESQRGEAPEPGEGAEPSPPEAGEPEATEPTDPALEGPPSPDSEPDWLQEIRRRHQKEGGAQAEDEEGDADISDTQPNVPIQPGEIPGWEEDFLPEETAPIGWDAEPLIRDPDEEEPQESAPAEEPAVPDRLQDPEDGGEAWMEGAEPYSEEYLPEPPEASEEESEDDAALRPASEAPVPGKTQDLPEWLLQDGEPAGEESTRPGSRRPFEGMDTGELRPAEMPSWLQALRPPGEGVEASSSRELLPEQQGVGPLAGLKNVLPAEPEVVRIGTPAALSGRLEVSETQAGHAATLRRLIVDEGRPKEDFSKQVARPSRLLNLAIAAVLLIATAIPVFTGSSSVSYPDASAHPEALPLLEAVDALPGDAAVLVAFDVEPALYGELQAPATQVLEHLLARQAHLVFISTQPTGPALAERLLAENLSAEPLVATGSYVNLGYLSGGMAALRAFAADPRAATTPSAGLLDDPWENPALEAIAALDDFGMVLVISSESEEARAWIEQSSQEFTGGLYMVASAQVAPLMRPYLDSHPQTLRGLVAGLGGAAYYELLRDQAGRADLHWDAYSYGLGAIVLAILLGGLYNRLIHIRPEPERSEEESNDA